MSTPGRRAERARRREQRPAASPVPGGGRAAPPRRTPARGARGGARVPGGVRGAASQEPGSADGETEAPRVPAPAAVSVGSGLTRAVPRAPGPGHARCPGRCRVPRGALASAPQDPAFRWPARGAAGGRRARHAPTRSSPARPGDLTCTCPGDSVSGQAFWPARASGTSPSGAGLPARLASRTGFPTRAVLTCEIPKGAFLFCSSVPHTQVLADNFHFLCFLPLIFKKSLLF